jgi:hypothetical protein
LHLCVAPNTKASIMQITFEKFEPELNTPLNEAMDPENLGRNPWACNYKADKR